MCVRVHAVVALVLLEQLAELVHVPLVQRVQLLRPRLLVPLHPNRTPDCREGSSCHRKSHHCKWGWGLLAHGMDGFSVGDQAEGVLENAAGVEERQRDAHDALQLLLRPAQPRSPGVLHLVKHLVLPEGEGWHQMSSADGRSGLLINPPPEIS